MYASGAGLPQDERKPVGNLMTTPLPGGVDPDLYAAKETAAKNRTGDVSRVRRGGCYADKGWPCRSAFRLRFEPERHHDHIGFRVVAVRP